MTEQELFDVTDPSQPVAGVGLPRASVGGLPPVRVGDDDVERRALLQLLAALGAGGVVPSGALETLRGGLDRAVGAADYSVDDWEQAAYDHACSISTLAPSAMVGALAADITDVQHTLVRDQSGARRAGMQRVAAQLSALMAMVLDETGDLVTAGRWWRTAQQAADASGDTDLQVWVRGRRAWIIDSSRQPSHVLYLATAAEEQAAGRPSAGLAEALLARSGALAVTGQRADALNALDRLGDVFTGLPAETTRERAAIWGWPERRYIDDRISVRLALGDKTVYDELAPRQARGPRGHAVGQLKTAWARIVAGGVSEGLDAAAETVSGLPVNQRTATVRDAVAFIGSAIPDNARTLPAARELQALTQA